MSEGACAWQWYKVNSTVCGFRLHFVSVNTALEKPARGADIGVSDVWYSILNKAWLLGSRPQFRSTRAAL